MKRVQVQGDYFHGQVPDGAVYVGRAAPGLKASPFANPYATKEHGIGPAMWLYSEHLAQNPDLVERAVIELFGKDLAC